MKPYSWLPVRGQLRTGLLIAGVVVGVVAPRVGMSQITPLYPNPTNNFTVASVNTGMLGGNNYAWPSSSGPSRGQLLTQGSSSKDAPKSSGGKAKGHMTKLTDPKQEEKDKKEDKTEGEEKDTGIKVNGQTLWEDSKGNRYYYVNGDKNSPFISVEQADGSFKWSTKNAMLDPVKPGQYGEIGMIETNGKLSTMYQLPDGSQAFRDGEMWKISQPGKNSFTATDKISFPNGSGTLTQYPGVGVTEPYKFGGGTGGGGGSDALFGGTKPASGEFGGSGGNGQFPTTTIPASSGSGFFTASGVPVPQNIVDQASVFDTPRAYSIQNGVWQACYGNYCRRFDSR